MTFEQALRGFFFFLMVRGCEGAMTAEQEKMAKVTAARLAKTKSGDEEKNPANQIEPIVRDVVYFLECLERLTGIGPTTVGKLERNGLPTKQVGNRIAIYGGDLIDHINKMPPRFS